MPDPRQQREAFPRPTDAPAAVHLPRTLSHLRRDWPILSPYQRFEAAIAWALTGVVGLIVVVALYRLAVSVINTIVLRGLNPLDHAVFQHVFGEIMTLLIALEFNHSLHYRMTPRRGIVHAKLVVLIAALAITRKIIIGAAELSATMTAALAGLLLALAVAYRLMEEPDRPEHAAPRVRSHAAPDFDRNPESEPRARTASSTTPASRV